MLDWLLLTAGGAAFFAASKWLSSRLGACRRPRKRHEAAGDRQGRPLRLVVAQCEARWFLEELQLAMAGDSEAMVRVSHMLLSGYGTKQDHAAAAAWMRQAWAIQNYREPAALHDMLDVRESAIPALNEARSAAPAAAAAAAVAAAAAAAAQGSSGSFVGSSSSSSSGGSSSSSMVSGSLAVAAAARGGGSIPGRYTQALCCDASSAVAAGAQEQQQQQQRPQQAEQEVLAAATAPVWHSQLRCRLRHGRQQHRVKLLAAAVARAAAPRQPQTLQQQQAAGAVIAMQ